MTSLNAWDLLEHQWTGKVYQKRTKEWKRFHHFETEIAPLFAGMRVVDVGCNAGIHALALARHVKHYVGVENDSAYHRQAAATAAVLPPGKCEFVYGDAVSYLVDHVGDYDALLLSCILYHLKDADVENVHAAVLPAVNFAAIYGRRRRPTIKNKWEFEKPEANVAFFESAGFQVTMSELNHPDVFCLVCRRVSA